jgi:hypothetical protein
VIVHPDLPAKPIEQAVQAFGSSSRRNDDADLRVHAVLVAYADGVCQRAVCPTYRCIAGHGLSRKPGRRADREKL